MLQSILDAGYQVHINQDLDCPEITVVNIYPKVSSVGFSLSYRIDLKDYTDSVDDFFNEVAPEFIENTITNPTQGELALEG